MVHKLRFKVRGWRISVNYDRVAGACRSPLGGNPGRGASVVSPAAAEIAAAAMMATGIAAAEG